MKTLTVDISPRDASGRRRVSIANGSAGELVDRLDLDTNYQRKRLLESAAKRFKLGAEETADLEESLHSLAREADARPRRGADLLRLDSVTPRPISWLWPSRFPLGKLALLCGDPDVGKTCLLCDMASRVSNGLAWPDGASGNAPASVLMLTSEDGVEDTLVPRLAAADADRSKIAVLRGWKPLGSDDRQPGAFSLASDLDVLESAIDEMGDCKLVTIDPVSAYLDGVDSHVNASVRTILTPLAELADRKGVCVVMLQHLSKAGGPAMYRSSGSIGFIAAARSAWAVVRSKGDPDVRQLIRLKCNLARDVGGLEYRIEERDEVPVLSWQKGAVWVNADEAMSTSGGEDRTERDEATGWLKDLLAGGAMESDEVKRACDAAGHSWRTIQRVKKAAGVMTYREGGFAGKGRWIWATEATPPQDPETWHS